MPARAGDGRAVRPAPLREVALALTLAASVAGSARAYEQELGESASLDLTITGEVRGVVAFDPDLPDEDPSIGLTVEADLDLPWDLRFISTISMMSDGTVQDPDNDHHLHDFRSVYQDSTPFIELEEAFLEIPLEVAELRLGVQKFAWGHLDAFNVTDQINSLDLTRPLDQLDASSKIGQPSASLRLFPEDMGVPTGPFEMLVIEGVLLPVAVPFRLPSEEDRWFPPLLRLSDNIVTDLTVPIAGLDVTLPADLGIDASYPEIDAPEVNARNLQWAARVTSFVGGVDVDLTYFDGFDSTPTADVRGQLLATRDSILQGVRCVVDPSGCPGPIPIDSRLELVPVLDRVRIFGGGFAASVGDVTVRMNGGYVMDRIFNFDISEDELLTIVGDVDVAALLTELYREGVVDVPPLEIGIESDSVAGGLQVEYITGDWVFNVGGFAEWVLDYDPDLIQDEVDVRTLFQIRRTMLKETLTFDLNLIWGVSQKDVVAMPMLSYLVLDGLEVNGGLLVIEGPRDALLGQYRQHDQLFVGLEYSWQ